MVFRAPTAFRISTVALAVFALLPHAAYSASPPSDASPPPGLAKLGHVPLRTAPAPPGPPAPRKAGVQYVAGGSPSGYIPCDVRNAYGITGTNLTGTGQTVAIIDYSDQSTIGSDLSAFDSDLGLPPATFSIAKLGSPPVDSGWTHEITLDVEWAHAIAPGARIVLVETTSATIGTGVSNGLIQGIDYAVGSAVNADVVSMSWGATVTAADVSFMQSLDPHLPPTNAAGRPVSYVASAGDAGYGPMGPALSPRAVGVGGTTVQPAAFGYASHPSAHLTCSPTLTPGVTPASETVWGSATGGQGTGGGFLSGYPKPSFQAGYGPSTGRSMPDVAMLADPSAGVATVEAGTWAGYLTGGTSLSAPMWAGVIAMLNQGRAAAGSAAERSPAWVYGAAGTDFNDIVTGAAAPSGDNSCVAAATCVGTPGYDMVTGRGSPRFASLTSDQVAGAGAPPSPSPSPSLAPTPTPTPMPTATPPPTPAPSPSGQSYTAMFPWYDNASNGVTNDNIHIVNPGPTTVSGTVTLGSLSSSFTLGSRQETFVSFPHGTVGGPVVLTASGRLIAAQRVQFYQSFNEVAAVPITSASTNLYFTWFDRISDPGFVSDNVVVANPGSGPTPVTVTIPGQPGCSSTQTIQPRTSGTFTCPSGFGGTVRVSAGTPVVASQRVQYYQTFNEVVGLSAQVPATYYLTWYDHASDPRFKADNIHIAYPNGRGSTTLNVPGCSPSLALSTADEDVYSCPQGSGFGGPVTVASNVPTVITQRVQYGSSFNETPSLSLARNGGTVLLMPWYDHASDPGFHADNIHVYFPGGSGHVTSIVIPGCSPTSSQYSNEIVFSCAAGTGFGGPVVVTTDTPALAAQRVQYYDSFNEAPASP